MSSASKHDQIKIQQFQQTAEAASHSSERKAAANTGEETKQPPAPAPTASPMHSDQVTSDKPSDKDGDGDASTKTSGGKKGSERKSKPGGRAMRELTREECNKMLSDGFTGRNAQRDRAYFATGLYLGLRVEELLAIKREDVYDYGAKKFREILYLSKKYIKGSGHSLKKKQARAAAAAAKKRKAPEAPASQPPAKRAPGAATSGTQATQSVQGVQDTQGGESDEVKALKQRIAQLEQRQAQLETPKTPLERMLAAENEQFKAKLAEEEAKRELRRRKVPPARIPIPARLHAFLEPLVVEKEPPSGPLFVSERLALGGEEKAPDSDTMLKTLKRAAKRAGLSDWEHVGNHSMKHTFTRAGSKLLGGDLAKLKKMTRHKSLAALVEYLKPGDHEIKAAFDGLDMLTAPAQPVTTAVTASSTACHSSSPSASVALGTSAGHLPRVSSRLTPPSFASTHSTHTAAAAPAPDVDADAVIVTVTVADTAGLAVAATRTAAASEAAAAPFQPVPRQSDGDVEMQPDAA